jgi:hypothetical protein
MEAVAKEKNKYGDLAAISNSAKAAELSIGNRRVSVFIARARERCPVVIGIDVLL